MQVNNIIRHQSYCVVQDTAPGKIAVVDLDTGMNYDIDGEELINDCESADQFQSIVHVNKTTLVEKMIFSNGTPFTVRFKKVNGDMRNLRGRFVKYENYFGNSMVEDLDKLAEGENALRQVHHEGIEWIIIDNVKYIRK